MSNRFLLSGSSARKLCRGYSNLLPGRLVLHYLHPLLATERGDDFDLGGRARRIVVYLGPRRQQLDRAEAIPVEEFLAELPS